MDKLDKFEWNMQKVTKQLIILWDQWLPQLININQHKNGVHNIFMFDYDSSLHKMILI